jgi:hypothetical protein
MGAVSYTAAKIAPVFPKDAKIRSYTAGVTITQGQPVYLVAATGLLALCDANDSEATKQPRGIALNGGSAGQAVDVLEDGECYGFTLSGNYESFVYVADAVGTYVDAAGSTAVPIGKVVPLNDKDKTKVLRVFTRWSQLWA